MPILKSALSRFWCSIPFSFSLALNSYFRDVTCSMHFNINLCFVLYCPIMYVMYFVLFLLLHKTSTRCTCFISKKRLWVHQNENSQQEWTGHVCTFISGNEVTVWSVYFYTIRSVIKCKNHNACVKVRLWEHKERGPMTFTL